MRKTVQGVRTLDCAYKLRIHYLLPEPVPASFLDQFAAEEVVVQEFSKFVEGAKDQFTIQREQQFRVAGVLGDTRLTATFGKSHGEAEADEAVVAFESVLAQCFGPVETEESA